MWLLVLILSSIVIQRERLINISGVFSKENLSCKYYIKKISKKFGRELEFFKNFKKYFVDSQLTYLHTNKSKIFTLYGQKKHFIEIKILKIPLHKQNHSLKK